MPRRRPTARPAWWAAAALCLASCAGPPPAAPEPVGCFVGPRRDLLRARRAVLVELDARPDCPPEVPPDTTRALAEAVQRRGLFKVEIVRRSDPACRDLPLGATGALTIEDLAGASKARPFVAAIMAIVMFSLIGLPPLAGFFAKWMVFLAAIEANLYVLAVIGMLASAISAFYYLRVVKVMYFDEPKDEFVAVPNELNIIMAVFGFLIVTYYFTLGNPLASMAHQAAGSLF